MSLNRISSSYLNILHMQHSNLQHKLRLGMRNRSAGGVAALITFAFALILLKFSFSLSWTSISGYGRRPCSVRGSRVTIYDTMLHAENSLCILTESLCIASRSDSEFSDRKSITKTLEVPSSTYPPSSFS